MFHDKQQYFTSFFFELLNVETNELSLLQAFLVFRARFELVYIYALSLGIL